MRKITVILLILACAGFRSSYAEDKKSEEGKSLSAYEEKLPEFSLKDAQGKKHSSKDLSKHGLVLVVTAPTLKNKDEQEDWTKYLSKQKSDKPTLVFLEDMEASNFKNKAKKEMKKESKKDDEPILLLDEKGKIREQLKVKKEDTVVLVYNDKGKLVHAEAGKPSSSSAEKIWKAAKD